MRFLISLVIVVFLFTPHAWADCKSDGPNDYQSVVNSCRANYDDPDDAEDLRTCMDDARKEYESCLEECETEASSTNARIGDIYNICI